MRKRIRRKRSKSVILNPNVWVRNSEDIKIIRSHKLKLQKGKCAVTGGKIVIGVLDHAHHQGASSSEDGRLRGVLDTRVNMLEGRFLKLFKRSKIEELYGITFEDFLINLGNYLKQDNSQEKFHFKYMDDFRKQVKRWGKPKLLERLESDFGIKMSSDTLVDELVQVYIQNWVYSIEEKF